MKNKQNTSVDIEAELQKLEAQRAALLEKKNEQERTRIAEQVKKIDSIPSLLGVDNLEAALPLIRSRIKGTLGSLVNTNANNNGRTVVDDVTKQKILDRVKAGGPGNQRSQICNEFGIHPQTLQNWLKAAGMTKTRGVAAAAAVEAPASSTATEAVAASA